MILALLFHTHRGYQNLLVNCLLVSLCLCSLACKKTTPSDTKEQAETKTVKSGHSEEQGGTIFTIRVLPNRDDEGKVIPVSPRIQTISINTIKKRINSLGIKSFNIEPEGDDKIILKLREISEQDLQSVRYNIQTLASLKFKLVHPESHIFADRVAADPENEIVPGYELAVLLDTDDEGQPTSENLLISRRSALNGSYIKHAQELYGTYAGALSVELDEQGATIMSDLTSNMNLGRDRLAIVLDGKVLLAPVVQDTLSKKFQISGMEDAKEAKSLATALVSPLIHPLRIKEERTIGPSSSE